MEIASNWKELTETVFERDSYECVECGSGEQLDLSHLIPVSHEPSLKYVIENCVTHCRTCHIRYHLDRGEARYAKALAVAPIRGLHGTEQGVTEEDLCEVNQVLHVALSDAKNDDLPRWEQGIAAKWYRSLIDELCPRRRFGTVAGAMGCSPMDQHNRRLWTKTYDMLEVF